MSILLEDSRAPIPVPLNAATPAERWQALRNSAPDWAAFRTLCGKLSDDYLARPLGALASAIYHCGYRPFHASYLADSDYLAAEAPDIISAPKLAAIQRCYTLAHISRFEARPGCSTCCIKTADGWRMMRSLDWAGAHYLGPAARRFVHSDSHGTTVSAGFVGMVGVLTFCRAGLTGAINYAPIKLGEQRGPLEFAHTDPLFLMRELVEHSDIASIADAIAFLHGRTVSSPVFITLCDRDDAVVLEISQDNVQHIVQASHGLLVQTNHYREGSPFTAQNGVRDDHTYALQNNSWQRQAQLEAALRPLVGQPAGEVLAACEEAFAAYPVQSGETAYRTWSSPHEGTLNLWRRMPTGNYAPTRKIIHLSDLHVGFEACETRLRDIVTSITEQYAPHTHVVVITGDLVDDAGGDNYQRARAQLDRLTASGFSVLVVPGNHDYGSGLLVHRRYIDAFKQAFYDTREVSYPKLDIGIDPGIAFIGLDSMAETFDGMDKLGADGELGRDQLTRLDAMLERPELRGRKIVVYLHHHPFDDSWVMQLKDHEAFARIVEGRVDYVLFGHDHDGYKEGGFVAWKEAGIQCHDASSSTGKSEAEHKPAAPVKVIALA